MQPGCQAPPPGQMDPSAPKPRAETTSKAIWHPGERCLAPSPDNEKLCEASIKSITMDENGESFAVILYSDFQERKVPLGTSTCLWHGRKRNKNADSSDAGIRAQSLGTWTGNLHFNTPHAQQSLGTTGPGTVSTWQEAIVIFEKRSKWYALCLVHDQLIMKSVVLLGLSVISSLIL